MIQSVARQPELRGELQGLMWLGFAMPGFVYTLSGLHTWYPAVPRLEQPYVLNQFLVDPPWNAVSWMPVYLSFAAIGLLYLVPGPLLFSLWFFFLFSRLQELVAAAYGCEPAGMPFFPCKRFIGYQTIGAYMVLAGYLLYTAAPRLRAAAHWKASPASRRKRWLRCFVCAPSPSPRRKPPGSQPGRSGPAGRPKQRSSGRVQDDRCETASARRPFGRTLAEGPRSGQRGTAA